MVSRLLQHSPVRPYSHYRPPPPPSPSRSRSRHHGLSAVAENEDHGAGEMEANVDEGESRSPVCGHVFPVTIRWSNITCFLSDRSSKPVMFLLKNVTGEAKPGRLLAIMGPGKTTLLNVLADQLAASPRLHLSGLLKFNGEPSSKRSYKFAYVRREDLFFSQLTVRETLSIAAELQLPVEGRDEYVERLLLKLGLVNCADTIVGDAKVRGISGGEKKRLSLACELLESPSVIFADEPTTGLDAFQAHKVMETLQQLAQDGHTVICSIHDPRGSVYDKFDDIVLLTEDSLVYAGPARDEPLAYFSRIGNHCPAHVSTAEFLADLISIDHSSAESVQSSRGRIDSLVESFPGRLSTTIYATPITKEVPHKNGKRIGIRTVAKKKGGWWKQFWLLLRRAWMQASRDGPTNKVRATMSIASAIIFGSVSWIMGRSQTSTRDTSRLDRMGLLQIAAINTAMATLIKTIGVFPKELAIVDRERAKGSYSLGPYLFSKLLAEIPIGAAFPLMFGAFLYPMARLHPTLLRFGKFCGIITVESFAASVMALTVGALVPPTEAAMVVAPSLMTLFIAYGGYYVNPESTPIIFRWIPRVSLIRWAFQGLCINEFSVFLTGEQALERRPFGGIKIRDTVVAQSKILLFWYCTTYLLLKRNRPKYQQLEPRSEPAELRLEQDDQPPEDQPATNQDDSKPEELKAEQNEQPLEDQPATNQDDSNREELKHEQNGQPLEDQPATHQDDSNHEELKPEQDGQPLEDQPATHQDDSNHEELKPEQDGQPLEDQPATHQDDSNHEELKPEQDGQPLEDQPATHQDDSNHEELKPEQDEQPLKHQPETNQVDSSNQVDPAEPVVREGTE